MAKFVPLRNADYAKKSWKHSDTFSFAARRAVVPIVTLEISSAAVNMPLAFIKQGDGFVLSAVLSLMPDQSLFIAHDGRWIGTYTPAILRAYPFIMGRSEDKMVLCVDEESELIQPVQGSEPFFAPDGSLSPEVKKIAGFLQRYENSKELTGRAVQALAHANVIVPWPMKVSNGKDEVPVAGMFRIDEQKLRQLDDATFLSLRNVNALGIAYAQIISMGRMELLPKLAELKEKLRNAPDQSAQSLSFLSSPADSFSFE